MGNLMCVPLGFEGLVAQLDGGGVHLPLAQQQRLPQRLLSRRVNPRVCRPGQEKRRTSS